MTKSTKHDALGLEELLEVAGVEALDDETARATNGGASMDPLPVTMDPLPYFFRRR